MYFIMEIIDMIKIKYSGIPSHIRHMGFWFISSFLMVCSSVFVNSHALTTLIFYAGSFYLFLAYRTMAELLIGGEERHVRIRWLTGSLSFMAGGGFAILYLFLGYTSFEMMNILFKYLLLSHLTLVLVPFLIILLKGEYQDMHFHFPTIFVK